MKEALSISAQLKVTTACIALWFLLLIPCKVWAQSPCSVSFSITPASCNGLNDGKIDVVVTGGSGNYSYLWSNGSDSKNLRNVGPGNYSVLVTDLQTGAVCSSTVAIVTQPRPMQVSITGNTILCKENATTLTAIGSEGTYRWINRPETTQSITVTEEGIYQVEVRNGNCSALSEPVTVVKQPTEVSIFANGTKLCPGDSIRLVSSYPTNNVWSTGATTRSILVGQAGTYWVKVDLYKCGTAKASVTISQTPSRLCKVDPCSPQYTVPVDIGNPCAMMAVDLATHNARVRYSRYLEEQKRDFKQRYITQCLQTQENLTLKYKEKEHHYTLYYYDLAGNLVRTVPPQGVKIITNPSQLATIRSDRKNNLRTIETAHDYATTNTFNSLDQPVAQKLPDHGTQATDKISTRLWYDELGRVVLAQNARQYKNNPRSYAYILYDSLSRTTESGEVRSPLDLNTIIKDPQNPTQLQTSKFIAWIANKLRYEVKRTYYDQSSFSVPGFTQEHLRGRVTSLTYETADQDNNPATYDHATHYSYDIHGNVKSLIHDNPTLSHLPQQRYKSVEYLYDLISGNVLELHYQKGKPDQFFHKNTYDADNRLSEVQTSADYVSWDREAKQFYYDHGPLARKELGHEKVQAMDFAYTIQGWIKGMNSSTLKSGRDMGKDGHTTGLHKLIPKDEVGYSLNYHNGDYSAISNPSAADNFLAKLEGSELEAAGKNLYNGNISHMVTGIRQFMQNGEGPLAMSFSYDQLNRLKSSKAYQDNQVATSNSWAATGTATDKYSMKLSYDANGNIMTLKRNAQAATTSASDGLDDLKYIYETKANGYTSNTNKLVAVQDARNHEGNPALAFIADIKQGQIYNAGDRTKDNYQYDEEGRLVSDHSEGIKKIEWNNLGKVIKVIRADTSHASDVEFAYDGSGQRIMKLVKPRTGSGLKPEHTWTYTYYVPDATGNVLAIYERKYEQATNNQGLYKESFLIAEQHIYGGEKLGYNKPETKLVERSFTATLTNGRFTSIQEQGVTTTPLPANPLVFRRGRKTYELSNHLDNVMAAVSDRRIAQSNNGIVLGYNSELMFASDYYPFGMQMPGRSFSPNNYRYGFGGKEKDNEIKSDGNSLDFGARLYDPRLGRWLTIDPMSAKYPGWSPYNYAMDSPLMFIDPDGEDIVFHSNNLKKKSQEKKAEQAKAYLESTQEGKRIMEQARNDKNVVVYISFVDEIKGASPGVLGFTVPRHNFHTDYSNKKAKLVIPNTTGFNIFDGLDITDDVMKGKKIYLVLVIASGDPYVVAEVLGHEVEAHVHMDNWFIMFVMKKLFPLYPYDGALQHIIFGSPTAAEYPVEKKDGKKEVVVKDGATDKRTSAYRLQTQLGKLKEDNRKKKIEESKKKKEKKD